MAIRQLDLPAIHRSAIQTQGMRQRNAMAGELGPLQVESAQIQNRLGQQQLDAASQPKPVDPEDVHNMIEWAQTPEMWDQGVDTFIQEGNPQFERYRGQFHRKEEFKALIAAQPSGKPMSGPGKVQYDINRGMLPEGTPLRTPKGPLVVNNVGQNGIDYGNPPSNMAWARDEGGNVLLRAGEGGLMAPVAVPVAGGPVETKAAAKEKAAEVKRGLEVGKVKTVVTTINQAIEMAKKSKIPVTGMGSLLSAVPGTPAHDLASSLLTIKANIGFDRLQQMRDSSVTGGALGAINKTEMDLLMSVQGSLEQSQTEGAFVGNLENVRTNVLDVVHGPGNWKLSADGDITVGEGVGLQKGGDDFSGMPDNDFSQVPLTADNAGAWLEEAKRRGLVQ